MPIYSLNAFGESNLTISGGQQLSGFTQGDGSHLVGETITIDNKVWETLIVSDNDNQFEDSQGNQRLSGNQSFDGTSYADGVKIEAEYTLTLQAPDGTTYTAISVNINEPGQNPAYGTVEGLTFLSSGGGTPPAGVPLTVIAAAEGPRGNDALYDDVVTPPCFVSGTLISTPEGFRPVESLAPGHMVLTRDRGARPLRWRAEASYPAATLKAHARLRPIRIAAGALGAGKPSRDLLVSPQHRILCAGAGLQVVSGHCEGLAAARHLVDDRTISVDGSRHGITYHHLVFDRHEVICAEGLWTESYRAGPETGHALPETLVRDLEARYPEFRVNTPPARPILSRHEARVWRAGTMAEFRSPGFRPEARCAG